MYRIAWIRGDGIGPEISEAALNVIHAIEKEFGISLEILFYDAGDECLKRRGIALPEETIEGIKRADASIKGPVGETAADVIVRLRQILDLYANIRPVKNYPGVQSIGKVDLVIVRENTEDLYKGYEFEVGDAVIAMRIISERASRRIARIAGEIALGRRRHVTIVHKANVLRKSCGLFLRVAREELSKYGVTVRDMLVDAASMALIRDPGSFDVILTTNMFGDILSDEAAQVAGSLGLAPSGNIGETLAIFEPVHGAAPDIAGKGIANPYAMILSTSMMFEWLGRRRSDKKLVEVSRNIEEAVTTAITRGCRTPDIGGNMKTAEVGRCVANIIAGGV
ncbi:MAG: isocitrate/isopropylmalate dehydrogenase family protein [Desulfurococcales archaeon]|jgi:3-isopropylmalate dehydrogenase|nr:isocitrate/isopropylmalate dehydrogenase family protein [Desulfurococcales archaeon]